MQQKCSFPSNLSLSGPSHVCLLVEVYKRKLARDVIDTSATHVGLPHEVTGTKCQTENNNAQGCSSLLWFGL